MASLSEIQSIIYEDCPYTNFPVAVDTIARKADVSLTTKALVDQYYSLISAGNFSGASTLLSNHPELRQVMSTALDYNQLRDGLIAVQRVFDSYIEDYIAAIVTPRGTYDNTATYKKYDVVTYTYDGIVRTYICLPANASLITIPVGTLPTNTSYWTCITTTGRNGASGTGLSIRGLYRENTTYYKNDLVVYNGFLYIGATAPVEDPYNYYTTTGEIYIMTLEETPVIDGEEGETTTEEVYTLVEEGSIYDPNETYYSYDDQTDVYSEILDMSGYRTAQSRPYEILNETPGAGTHWVYLPLSNVYDEILPGTTITPEDWVDSEYVIENDVIDSNTLVEVFFGKSSLFAASEACIIVESGSGTITLTCLGDAPTSNLAIDYIRIRKDINV